MFLWIRLINAPTINKMARWMRNKIEKKIHEGHTKILVYPTELFECSRVAHLEFLLKPQTMSKKKYCYFSFLSLITKCLSIIMPERGWPNLGEWLLNPHPEAETRYHRTFMWTYRMVVGVLFTSRCKKTDLCNNIVFWKRTIHRIRRILPRLNSFCLPTTGNHGIDFGSTEDNKCNSKQKLKTTSLNDKCMED